MSASVKAERTNSTTQGKSGEAGCVVKTQSALYLITQATYVLSTHPETVVHVWDVLFSSQGPAAPQTLPQLLDLNRGEAEVSRVGIKIDLWVAVFGPSGSQGSKCLKQARTEDAVEFMAFTAAQRGSESVVQHSACDDNHQSGGHFF